MRSNRSSSPLAKNWPSRLTLASARCACASMALIGANASTASALVGQAPTTAAVATPAPEIEHTKIVLSQDAALVTVTLASPLVYSNPTLSYQLLDANMSALSPSWSTIVASLSADKQSIEARVPIDENGQSAGISFYVSAVDNSGVSPRSS